MCANICSAGLGPDNEAVCKRVKLLAGDCLALNSSCGFCCGRVGELTLALIDRLSLCVFLGDTAAKVDVEVAREGLRPLGTWMEPVEWEDLCERRERERRRLPADEEAREVTEAFVVVVVLVYCACAWVLSSAALVSPSSTTVAATVEDGACLLLFLLEKIEDDLRLKKEAAALVAVGDNGSDMPAVRNVEVLPCNGCGSMEAGATTLLRAGGGHVPMHAL